MVTPSAPMATSVPSALQPSVLEWDSRWITQTTSPLRASRTWPKMTGTGSRLAAAPRWVTSFSMSQTASR